ncbi:MAG TPA: TetR/AcrR family transcriptional regulator [Pseudomonas sabulinigri]|jgi:AcrR family transcriptional regulator|uniref:HTH tetR-type domain-containing protein n=1 Tax=marine sediment metagenome TaxID=412755 RepID=A0A0F9WY19_9ZZZZ|nr:TetR/AcrR family transcriptional regulator [Halopseudomonas sabulinigri]HEC52598.1 TetR/AcrR family transcriptional regulator [Halopseudomonas sabulinigri]|tara:strand:- start:7321 stop:7911 length:591 start_codon:yes stop_codon:yes gene_type:complete
MKRQSTRERILVICRTLFNDHGIASVTTAAIAQAAGINEGNLYYYFKKKANILSALFEQFAEEQLALAEQEQDMRAWFQVMWEWRFFYRDSMIIFAMEPALRAGLRELSDQVQGQGRKNLSEMVKSGRMQATEAQLEVLLENSWIISTYWIEYLHSRHGISEVTKEHLDWGYKQMSALFEPYFVPVNEKPASSAAS